MICGVIAGRFPNEKQRWPGSAPVMAFSMSNMPRDTVTRCLPPSATLALRASFQKTERPPYGLSKRWIKVKESEGIGGDACSGRDILMQQQSERAANLHALATRLEFTIKQTGDRFTLRRTADVAGPVREEGAYFR